MRTFKSSSLSSKELTLQKSSEVIYCNLNQSRKTNRTHTVNDDRVSSQSHHDKLQIIRGKEVFFAKIR